MKESKKEFKYALRACPKSKEMHEENSMTVASQDHSPKKFRQHQIKQKETMAPIYGWRNFFNVVGHKCTSKKYRKFLWFELATVTPQALKYDVINF